MIPKGNFDDFAAPFTLKFCNQTWEERFRNFKQEMATRFDRSKTIILMIACSMTLSSCFMAYQHYKDRELNRFWALVITAFVGNISIILEFVLHRFQCLAPIRGLIMTTGMYFSAVYYSCEFLPSPGLLPG